jgi:hypothetical protein
MAMVDASNAPDAGGSARPLNLPKIKARNFKLANSQAACAPTIKKIREAA